MFSGAKIPRPIIHDPLEFKWIIEEISKKQHVRKSLCPTEKLWAELITFFQPELNKIRVSTGTVKSDFFQELKIRRQSHPISLILHG